jgi:hypothetical protein
LRRVIAEVLAARADIRAGARARSLLDGFIEQAEQTSVRALRQAARTSAVATSQVVPR